MFIEKLIPRLRVLYEQETTSIHGRLFRVLLQKLYALEMTSAKKYYTEADSLLSKLDDEWDKLRDELEDNDEIYYELDELMELDEREEKVLSLIKGLKTILLRRI